MDMISCNSYEKKVSIAMLNDNFDDNAEKYFVNIAMMEFQIGFSFLIIWAHLTKPLFLRINLWLHTRNVLRFLQSNVMDNIVHALA